MSMTFDQFWAQLLSKQPWMSDADKRFEGRVGELRRLCRLAYDSGYRYGESSGCRSSSGGSTGASDFPDFFNDLLGNLNRRK